MLLIFVYALLIGYLPGAILYRIPYGQRQRRAALAVEERLFWHVLLSIALSLTVVLCLAALERYRFSRLLIADGVVCVLPALVFRGRLRFAGEAARPTVTALIPIVLIAIGAWRFFPSSEYVIGGKDPGVYMNEGVQIAQRGGLVVHDAVVASVPPYARDLFFPSHYQSEYYSNRFMGFFLQDPRTGAVVGQFPHLYPASIAIGYGMDGLSGARMAIGVWTILGLIAVYVTGARLLGALPAFAASALLALNVVEVFFGRYPNAEIPLQALLFAALLAFARAHQDNDGFFAPIAGGLTGLLLFTRIDAALAVAAIVAAATLVWVVDRRPPRLWFVITLAAAGVLAVPYLTGPMRAYLATPQLYAGRIPIARTGYAAVGLIALVIAAWWIRRQPPDRVRRAVSGILVVTLIVAAAWAWFFRVALRAPDSKLAIHDASALRVYTDFYLLWPALAAALAGLVIVARERFWRDPALLLTIAAYSLFFFYKIHIVPVHFWAARHLPSAILPGAMLLACGAAFGVARTAWTRARVLRTAAGGAFVVLLGIRYAVVAAPVMPHVEYRGIIPHLESLASKFGDRDLVLVESRVASDLHVLATPLSYIYARAVLVLNTPRPDKLTLRTFLDDVRHQYGRVFFIGGGGTDLLSRRVVAVPVSGEKIQVDEYDQSSWDVFPAGIRHKEFDYGIYELKVGNAAAGPFSLDVGYQDDLNVVRFNAKESTAGRTIRWTGRQSFVTVTGLTGQEREVVIVMHDGGRPAQAGPAEVQVFFNEVEIGHATVGSGFAPYRFAIPADVAAAAGRVDDPAQLKLISSVWNPHDVLGAPDTRTLGVMVDRVEVH